MVQERIRIAQQHYGLRAGLQDVPVRHLHLLAMQQHHAIQRQRQHHPEEQQQRRVIPCPQHAGGFFSHPQPPHCVVRLDAVAAAGQTHDRHDSHEAHGAYHRRAADPDHAIQIGLGVRVRHPVAIGIHIISICLLPHGIVVHQNARQQRRHQCDQQYFIET